MNIENMSVSDKNEINFYKKVDKDTFIDELDEMIISVYNNINKLMNDTKSDVTYENFYKPYCLELNRFDKLSYHLGHLKGVKYDDELNELSNVKSSKMNNFYFNKLPLKSLYEHIKLIDTNSLNLNIKKKLEDELVDFESMGVNLSTTNKSRLEEVSNKLSELSNKFSKNQIDSVNSYELIITNKEDVSEFPTIELDRFIKTDEEGNVSYRFGLDYPSYSAYMKYGNNRDTRKELNMNFTNRGGDDNLNVIIDILKLRKEKATILGYNNYSDIRLKGMMLNTPEKVYNFINNLSSETLIDNAKEETNTLFEYSKTLGFNGGKLEQYDTSYYINHYKTNVLSLDSLEVSKYFEKDHTVNMLFGMLDKMFNLNFQKNNTYETWSDDVDVYDVYKNETLISTVYFDLEAREGKRSGAWMNNSHTGYIKDDGEFEQSVAYVTCNFNKSTDSSPSLLNFGDVETLFHEMGHVLQHICSNVDDIIFSGINGIEWDAVEWSSQFMEEFLYKKDVLNDISSHYLTGDKLPSELSDKIISNKKYNNNRFLSYQLFLTKFDMDIHNNDIENVDDLKNIIKGLDDTYDIDKCEYDNFQNSFSHIFAGSYSSAYYSYLWSNVLSIDAFKVFDTNGIYDKDNCENYYNKFLSLGYTKPSIDMFVDYVGRHPNPKVLIEY